LGAELLAVAISGAALLWMVYRAFLGLISLGDLALFYQAFQRGQSLVRTLLGNLGQIYSNSLYLTNLFEFLGLQGSVVDAADAVPAPEKLRSGIRFTDVSFRYPGRSSNTLTDFNGFFPAGKIIALVGENGAGKSTLLKLIARLYDPQFGRVQLDGIDTRRIALSSLRARVGFMFQAPVYYDMTAKDNIALGNLAAAADMDRIERVAATAGAHGLVRQLPNGYDTMLGCFFPDGRQLSHGEWQRIALARALIHDAEILLLDEPTSAMDPWAEADWYDRLRAAVRGRTVIMATHRPSIARRADLIFVLKQGAIAEAGSPGELLARGGKYAEWFEPSFEAPELSTAAS
jgi:ATP-binding cassette subfamily B protein